MIGGKNACLPITLLVLLASLGGGRPAHAQEQFVPPAVKHLTSFNFTQLTGGVIIIKACIPPHKDSLNFILDTGSGGISLDSTTVAALQIPNQTSDRTIRGIAGIRPVKFAYNLSLSLPGLVVDSLHFHINDYELLSGVYGIRIDGIIGYSFLKRYVVRVDYEKLQIDVFTPGLYKYPKGGHLMRPRIAGLPIQSGIIREARRFPTRFYLDTGAGLCLLLSEEFCTDSSLFPAKRKRFKTVTEGLGGKKDMEMTVLKEFRLGPYKFKKVPIYIFEDDYNVTSYPSLGGLIGNDLLRRFNVVINYPREEVHLLPNKHYREAFDYAYSGMGLFADGTDIVVSDVIAGSPADKAGLREGDHVVAMDNDFSRNLQSYKTLLQNIGNKIKVIVKRDSDLFETTLAIKSIL